VDEDALYEACKAGRIGGAVIDVWWRYPKGKDDRLLPSRHPLHELDNVILTPHTSGWSAGLHERRWRVIAANLDRLARGEPLVNLVRRPTSQ
jgi:phosphoglycerate dehydrogenase-like enzyme